MATLIRCSDHVKHDLMADLKDVEYGLVAALRSAALMRSGMTLWLLRNIEYDLCGCSTCLTWLIAHLSPYFTHTQHVNLLSDRKKG